MTDIGFVPRPVFKVLFFDEQPGYEARLDMGFVRQHESNRSDQPVSSDRQHKSNRSDQPVSSDRQHKSNRSDQPVSSDRVEVLAVSAELELRHHL